MIQMYDGVVNSIETVTTGAINATDTIINVLDETRIPEAPNILVLGSGASAETVKLVEKNGSVLTVERGLQGTAKSWASGTLVARNFTEYDHRAFKENIETLNTNQQETNSQLAQHVNETNYYQLANITRDLTLTGVQTISGLPFVPEMLIVEGSVNNTKKMFTGKQVGTTKFVVYSVGDTGNYLRTNRSIAIADTSANITFGDITIKSDNTVDINWTKEGTGATGTLLMTLVAIKHGGV